MLSNTDKETIMMQIGNETIILSHRIKYNAGLPFIFYGPAL